MPNGRVAALRVPGGGTLTRKEIDDYTPFVAIYGAKGLAYIKVNDAAKPNEEGLQSPIVKFLSEAVLREILARTGAQTGDVDLLRRRPREGRQRRARRAAREGRPRARVRRTRMEAAVGRRLPDVRVRRRQGRPGPRGIIRSPRRRTATRTASSAIPGSAIAKAYDVVLNGWEIGGGSVRIHRADVQQKVFAALRHLARGPATKFGFLLDALSYGAPPHGGIAFGLDRIVAMMAGVEQIRDVIAFPKTQRGQDLLVDAPTPVTEQQLRDLHIRVRPSDSAKLA